MAASIQPAFLSVNLVVVGAAISLTQSDCADEAKRRREVFFLF
jgi:hypothetical protein